MHSFFIRLKWRWLAVGIFLVAVGGTYNVASAPADFSPSLVAVARGSTVKEVAQQLGKAHVVRYPLLLEWLLRAGGKESSIQAATYNFEKPQSLSTIARRLAAGDSGLPDVRLTFVEGATVREMAALVSDAFQTIAVSDFSALARKDEGYLFPDTYFFPPSATAASIHAALRENFDTKITTLSTEVSKSGHSLSDLVTMASLVEKEARTDEDRRIIAGILWKRLELGMPLQVDAVFGYIKNRDTYSPTLADLKIESPYNTYLHAGLPPGPIANPGLASLEAVLNPTKTDYLYYLTGKDGKMYYAKTYTGHLANQRKYLN